LLIIAIMTGSVQGKCRRMS